MTATHSLGSTGLRLGLGRLLALLALLLFASPATALDISAVFNLGASQFANGVQSVNGPNDIVVDLTPGDVVALDIIVANAPRDRFETLFTSLVVHDLEVGLIGGGFNPILNEGACTGFLCTPRELVPFISGPIEKANSPASQGTGTEQWIQVVGHTLVGGANGPGPDVASTVGFTIGAGVSGFERIDFLSRLTPGDVASIPGGGDFMGPINLSSAVINIPEPGAASLLGLGLFGLAGTRRRRTQPQRS